MMWDAIIGAGSSILGGILGNKGTGAKATYRNTDAGIHAQIMATRKYAEQYGFNPLAWVGNTSVTSGGGAGGNYMGAAIADAGLMLADGLAKRKDAQKLQQAERLNATLQKKVTDLTIRPKVGGVYQQFAAPSGGSNGPVSRQGSPALRAGSVSGDTPSELGWPALDPLRGSDPSDPRRGTDNKPVSTHPGWMTIDNPSSGRMWFPTLDGDEALDLTQYPTALYGFATRERGIGGRLVEGMKTGDWDWAIRGPRTGLMQPNLDYLSSSFRAATSPKPKPMKRPRARNTLAQHDYLQPNYWAK